MTPEEIEQRNLIQTKSQRQHEAKIRAIQAILSNQTGAPWGAILYDFAVAQGLVEP